LSELEKSDLEKVAAKRMRMLRLRAGWSAEKLSQKYRAAGVGSLPRTMIAKIESDKRQIRAREVEGVARVFGLTSDDLLDRDGPSIILSYAEQDRSTGQEVAAWLRDHGFQVAAGLPATDDPEPGSGDRHGIDTAQAFVVLLSSSFLSSARCRDELALAVRREQHLLSAGHAADFIYVLRLAETPDLDDSGLQSFAAIDLTLVNEWSKEVALSKLGGSILSGARTTTASAHPQTHVQTGQEFLDRAEELERVLYTIRNSAGPQFWLVISPPGLGKSRFLGQLAAKAGESPATSLVIRSVDLRHGESGREYDAMTVVRELFELEESPSPTPEDELRGVAQKIIRTGQPWLCLMDSAELLPPSAVTQLRQYLSKVYRLIQDARNTDARLAFVVASRHDDRWRGVTPSPGLSFLPLGGFGVAAVQDALEELARGMPRVVRSPAELRRDAALVQGVTEGVPELVLRSLRWIQEEEWIEIDRLADQQLFDEIISPYIQDRLLDQDSLLPGEEGQPSESAKQLDALREALRALVPYRLFTQYHVQHELDSVPSFREALKDANWRLDDLWQAIAGTALLYRPLNEPWQELHPMVRRLLYRHFYLANDHAEAQRQARDFTKKWAAKLTGKEQIVGMVETIWHEAATLRSVGTVTMGDDLTSFARKLSFDISPSPYSEAELRDYAAERIRNDDELQREVDGVEGLFDKLVEAVLEPESS
jgi:transcriptional regulator with XRE-family HTH domain